MVALMRVPAIGTSRRGGPEGLIARGARSTIVTLPAPIGGWNARDPLSAMQAGDAIQLDNFIPDTGGVKLREGYSVHATDMTVAVTSLMAYAPPDSSNEELFAATDDTIWDVTDAGAATSAVTGLTGGFWQHVMFATSGGNFLVACNGVDSVRNYNGSSWSTPSITGVTSSNLVNVAVHARRLWFCENNSLDAWYLGTSSISGSATSLPLGPLCQLGGHLQAIASWTRDGGAGMDDLWVGITSKGEAIVYAGTDPSQASSWQLQGVFRVPEPVGRRCVVKTGADLGLITSQGVLPFSTILPLAQSGAARVAATNKISGAVATAYEGASTARGWQLIEYPKGRLLILNVPIVENTTSHQYVMNTQTGQWCRFKGIDALCWELLGDELYFGAPDGTVYKYGGTFIDNKGGDEERSIEAVSISAYTNFGTVNRKMVKMVRPLFTGPEGYAPFIGIRADYDTGIVNYTASELTTQGALWDEAEWDVAEWALSQVPSARWQSAHAQGSVLSVAMAVNLQDKFQFNAIDLMLEAGGYL